MSDMSKAGDVKPRVAYVGIGSPCKHLICGLRGVEGFSVFLYSERPAVPDAEAMEWKFSKIDPSSPDSPTPIDLVEELSHVDIAFVIDYCQPNTLIKEWFSTKVVELARDCGAIPIRCHVPIPPIFARAKLIQKIKERFSVADEALMQYARDTYAERGLLSSYELSIANKVGT